MEAAKHDTRYDIFTSKFSNVEIADDNARAILLLPLMHVGPNKKGLLWTAKMLKQIGPMFRSVPYRYDLEGQEGSSHTLNKLSSPHFDVGWTYSSEEGSWYDSKTKTLWTKGEVTHPAVIAKLARITSDGKREVNYGSMGVIVEKAICSICGSDMSGNTCENGHNRLEKYEGKTCYKVPTEISKALHVALTNDPADGEAEIKNVLIQEMGAEEIRNQAGEQMEKPQLDNQMQNGMAPGSPQTGQPGEAPSAEVILKDLAERIKTIEQKLTTQVMGAPDGMNGTNTGGPMDGQAPELLNTSPQDQFTQDNMGNTTQFDTTKDQNPMEQNPMGQDTLENKEADNMDAKDGQGTNEKVPVNPAKPETQDVMGGDPMSQIMGMLQQIIQRLGGAETQDMGKEAQSATIGMAKKAQDDLPTEHLGEGKVGNTEDAGNAKNKANMNSPDKTATADMGTKDAEIADLRNQIKQIRSKLEFQDNNDIPEFGGAASNHEPEIADMGAKGRTEKFGEFGAWDSIFNGKQSAEKFNRRY